MSQHTSPQSFAAIVSRAGLVALVFAIGPASAQNDRVAAPVIPVDIAALTKETAPAAVPAKTATPDVKDEKSDSRDSITDYSTQIGNGLKERERRLMLLNEAMMKLREAGEMEDASHVELRIRALLEMPPPSQGDLKARAEIEQLKSKNDELALQVVALQEELKRSKTAPVATTTRRGMAANSER